MRQIIKDPKNPVLLQQAKRVEEITDEVREIAEEMKELVLQKNLLGLAAPQVGESIRMFVVDVTHGTDKEPKPTVFINPKIKRNEAKKKALYWEGCESIPNMSCLIERFKEVSVEWTDLDNATNTQTFNTFTSVIIQHEADHLNGKLMTSKARQKRIVTQKSNDAVTGESNGTVES